MIPNKKPDPAKELEKLERLCVQSELCAFDVMMRLRKRGIVGETATKILASLVKNRFVDDERFANAFAYTKAQAAWGPMKIKLALAQKQIKDTVVRNAIAQVEQRFFDDGLLRAVRTKAMSLGIEGAPDFEDTQKIVRFAVGRGFEPAKVIALIKEPEKWQSKEF